MARRISGKPKARRSGPAGPERAGGGTGFRPSREQVLSYIADNPERSGRREIAKAFSLKNEDRAWLKDLLRELEEEGLVQKHRKRLSPPGALPNVAVLDIVARDEDGGLLARPAPTEGQRDVAPAMVALRTPRGQKGPAVGVGDRVLARIFPAREKGGPAYTARVMKSIDRRREAERA